MWLPEETVIDKCPAIARVGLPLQTVSYNTLRLVFLAGSNFSEFSERGLNR